jgi:hypothetical protein
MPCQEKLEVVRIRHTLFIETMESTIRVVASDVLQLRESENFTLEQKTAMTK